MLSESAAKKLFGANQPVGKIFLLKNKPLTVAGGYWLKSYDTKIALSWWIFAGSAVIVFTVV